MNPVVVIPARMASTRLPGKPLADINGKPMIQHVIERALESKLGDVVVAAGDQVIIEAVKHLNCYSVLTDPNLPSGSDRIHAALEAIDPKQNYTHILNLQGDLPDLNPNLLKILLDLLNTADFDISTLCYKIKNEEELKDPSCVKIAMSEYRDNSFKALYFSRSCIPYGNGPFYHHIGLYGYLRDSLNKFVKLSPSPLEQREKLEQLRAIENDMKIGVKCVDDTPFGIDTQDDLKKIKSIL
jgi:3-deoxy-manno-octulosonate cytidylyltransferase (CMP-KDO synthetase)